MATPAFKPYELDWSALKRETPQWFRNAKFGLFFHWGPYSVPAFENEWYSRNMYGKGLSQNLHHVQTYGPLHKFGYKDFYNSFKGEQFDPEEWAHLVVRSGARYAGPVTEHSDNFSLWDSAINPINSLNYGPKRDVVGELKQAFTRQGVRFAATFHHHWLWGWFMSSDPDADVYDPANEKFYGKSLPLETNRYIPWRFPDDDFNRTWARKIAEVVDRYDPDLIYFDSRMAIIDEKVRMEMLKHCYHGPGGRPDRVVTYKQEDLPVQTGILDVECGRFSKKQDFVWQTDDRLEARRTWCYVENPRYKSATMIIHQLCDVVSKNGNLLLNIGPKADGTFDKSAVAVLQEIGDWLNIYGEAIYDTRPFTVCGEGAKDKGDGEFDVSQIESQIKTGIIETDSASPLNPGDVCYTTNNDTIFAILPYKGNSRTLRLESLGDQENAGITQIKRIDIINGEENLEWSRSRDVLIVKLKGDLPSTHANVIRIETLPKG